MPSKATPQIGNHAAYNGRERCNAARGVLEVVLTVKADVPLPLTEAGLNEQAGGLVTAGTIPQVKVTAPVNPFVGVTVTVDVADAPAEMDAGDNAVAETVKSGVAEPVTAKVTVVLCPNAPEVPVTVNVYVFDGVPVVETVSADVPALRHRTWVERTTWPISDGRTHVAAGQRHGTGKPDNAPTVTVEVAELPAATEAGANAVAATEKSGTPTLGASLAMNASATPPPNVV